MKSRKISNCDGKVHLDIEGEVTVNRMEEIAAMINPALASGRDIEIGLSQVTQMDKAGSHFMLAIKIRSLLYGSQLNVVGCKAAVVQEYLGVGALKVFFD